jgi:hypothetical protein
MKMVECYHCKHCLGIEILNVITARAKSGEVLSLEDIAVYKCAIFDYVEEDFECFECSEMKEVTLTPKGWVAM